MKKTFKSCLILAVTAILCFPNFIVNAQENVSNSSDTITQYDIQLSLSDETKAILTNVEDQYGIPKSYFYDIVDMYFNNGYTNLDELNTAIQDAARQMATVCEKTEMEYQNVLNNYQANINNNRISRADPIYTTAMGLFRAGISIVEKVGCPETARSMNHAIVPESQVGTGWEPGRLHYDNVDWSKYLIRTQEFWQTLEGQFQKELGSGKDVITFSGTHAFTQSNSCLDAYVQLHKVDYTATFVKVPQGWYTGNVLISDVYDFDWGNYDNIAVGFGNNYCKAAQDAGFIAPYPIYVSGKL